MYGRIRRPARLDPAPDQAGVRAVAAVRLAVLVAVAAAGSFRHGLSGGTEAFFLVAGLVGIPWAIVVLFATETRDRAVVTTAWAGDLLLVGTLQVLVPGGAGPALTLSVAVVAVTGYVVRSAGAWTAGVVAVVLAAAGQLLAPAGHRASAGELALYVAAVAGVCTLAERVSGERRRAAAWATQLEGRAAAILDNVADAVVLTDARGVVRSLNPAARRLVGDAVLPGSHCNLVLRLHRNERALDCTGGCALLALARDDREDVPLWRPYGGRRVPVLANAAVVPGETVEVVHSIRDITKLMEADEAKTVFLATASHELKTPLTVINGFTDTLLRADDIDPATRHDALVAIHRRGLELAKIVDRLLMSSRIEAGRLSLDLTAIDLTAVLVERVAAIRTATDRDVRLDVEAIEPTPWGSADAIATVVEHLLDNALKYTPDNGAVVVRVEVEGDDVLVAVGDTGVGMSVEQAGRCFDKFWQADATDARRFGGTGIGLYIVRSLVEAMRGTVSVTTAPGAGSEFLVRLPTLPSAVVPGQRDAAERPGEGSMILEFMRQIGVGEGGPR
jgi:PAS domain S-box-containing protein